MISVYKGKEKSPLYQINCTKNTHKLKKKAEPHMRFCHIFKADRRLYYTTTYRLFHHVLLAVHDDDALVRCIDTLAGYVVHLAVADGLGIDHVDI